MSWHLSGGPTVTLRVRSGGVKAWGEQLERCGFAVAYEQGEVKATSREVTDVYVIYAEVDIAGEK